MQPITLAKLLEFCVFSISHQHKGRFGLISLPSLIKEAKQLWNYIMCSSFLNYVSVIPGPKVVIKELNKHVNTVRSMKKSDHLCLTQWPVQPPQDPILVVESVYSLFEGKNTNQVDLEVIFKLFQFEVSQL